MPCSSFSLQYYEMSYGLNVEMHKQVSEALQLYNRLLLISQRMTQIAICSHSYKRPLISTCVQLFNPASVGGAAALSIPGK